MAPYDYGRFVDLRPRPDIVFLGSPKEAAIVLEALIGDGITPKVVLTNPPKRRGRGSEMTHTPVGDVANANGISVIHTPSELSGVDFELGVVVAYGHILREEILSLGPFVNLHFSILPRWRGAAPVERAILAFDKEIGVSLMAIGAALDEGAVFDVEKVPLCNTVRAQDVRENLAELGAQMLTRHLILGGLSFSDPQDQFGEVTYASKLTTAERKLDFSSSADLVDAYVRVGGAWTMLLQKRIQILASEVVETPHGHDDPSSLQVGSFHTGLVSCGSGFLRLKRVQPQGRSPMSFDDWIRGLHLTQSEMVFDVDARV